MSDLRHFITLVERWETLYETENILDGEPLGAIIQVKPESNFGATSWYMKFADGTWRPVIDFAYLHGQPAALYRGADPVDPQKLLTALAANRVSRPVEGIHPGDHIKASAQMHALPDGAVIINPQTGSLYHKKDGRFFVTHRADPLVGHGEVKGKKAGDEVPDYAFRSDNAQWEK